MKGLVSTQECSRQVKRTHSLLNFTQQEKMYQSLTDELIRDKIIAGMANRRLAQQLQNLEKEPTLEMVVNKVRHAKVVSANQHLLSPQQTADRPVEVNYVNRKKTMKFSRPADKQQNTQAATPRPQASMQAPRTCGNCGETAHSKEVCKARESNL